MPLHVSCRADDADKHESDVTTLVFKKGKLYSGGDDGKVKAWASDLRFIGEAQAHQTSVFSLTASDEALYSCSNDGTIRSWEFDSLKEKAVILKEADTEIWKVKFVDGVLYSGDDQGNVRVHKNGSEFFGSVNVAEPIKDLTVYKDLLFTVKDNDVAITELILDGDKLQFASKSTLIGRGPLLYIDNKLFHISRDGKEVIINASENDSFKEIADVKASHEMIINAVSGAVWDNQLNIFTGGWDKKVKRWIFENNTIKLEDQTVVDIVVNALTVGEKGEVYAAGSDGHIVRVEV